MSDRYVHVETRTGGPMPAGTVMVRHRTLPHTKGARFLGDVHVSARRADLDGARDLAVQDGWCPVGEWRVAVDGYVLDVERLPEHDPAATGFPRWPQT